MKGKDGEVWDERRSWKRRIGLTAASSAGCVSGVAQAFE